MKIVLCIAALLLCGFYLLKYAIGQPPLPLASAGDPVSSYLRYGTVCCGAIGGFVPLAYWGQHNDVFKFGMDPLVHFLAEYNSNYLK